MVKIFENIEALFFDFGGTLDSDGIAWKERFFSIYQKNGLNIQQHVFDRAFYDADDSLTLEDPENFSYEEIVHEQVRRVLENLGMNDIKLKEKVAGVFYQSSIEKINKNIPVLMRLKERFKLGIISNNYGNLKRISADSGLIELMDIVVDSNRVGFEKPDIRIFQFALNGIGVSARNSIMVGDSLKRDMLGAKNAGMPHVFLVSKDRLSDAGSCCTDDPVISSLAEIEGLPGL